MKRKGEREEARLLGMVVGECDSETRAYPDRRGVVVLGVDPEGPAAEAWLPRGCVLVELNGAPLSGVSDLRRKLASAGDRAYFLVQIGEGTLFVGLRR